MGCGPCGPWRRCSTGALRPVRGRSRPILLIAMAARITAPVPPSTGPRRGREGGGPPRGRGAREGVLPGPPSNALFRAPHGGAVRVGAAASFFPLLSSFFSSLSSSSFPSVFVPPFFFHFVSLLIPIFLLLPVLPVPSFFLSYFPRGRASLFSVCASSDVPVGLELPMDVATSGLMLLRHAMMPLRPSLRKPR